MKSADAISVSHLTTKFGKKTIHNDISFCIQKNSICALIGGSGSGKTTLLKALLGLLTPTAGVIKILNQELQTLDIEGKTLLKKKLAVLFQDGALFSGLTVLDNILFPLTESCKIKPSARPAIGKYLVELVGLEKDVLSKMPSELSGGMRKRVGLARALILEPEILFLDEPTSGLDPISARHFDQLILDLHKKLDTTIIMISHDIESICSISQHIIALGGGKIIADGDTNTVVHSSEPWIKEYFKSHTEKAK